VFFSIGGLYRSENWEACILIDRRCSSHNRRFYTNVVILSDTSLTMRFVPLCADMQFTRVLSDVSEKLTKLHIQSSHS
jgi:hypothetical protein